MKSAFTHICRVALSTRFLEYLVKTRVGCLLKNAHVAVVPGTEFGGAGEGYIRLSFATKMPLIEKALDKIERFLK